MRGNGSGRSLGLGVLIALGLPAPVQAMERNGSADRVFAIGVMAHDRGIGSDEHEAGTDLNLEMQFAPRALFGSPRPHLGATLNFQGDTSVAYAGLGFRLHETPSWHADLFVSAALHDGPLHKEPAGCRQNSDCGYGIRVIPRFGLGIGYRISPVASVSLLADHMSHKWLIGGENEGLDHIGLRYLRSY
jgi:lipid A 3-O-deacylase